MSDYQLFTIFLSCLSTLYIAATEEAPPCCQCDNTGIVVGAVIAIVVVVLAMAVTVVLVTYLVLRHKRGGKP